MQIGTKSRNLIYFTFFIAQFLIVVALLSTKKFDYIRDIIFITAIVIGYIFLEVKHNILVSNYTRVGVITIILAHEIAGKYFEFYLRSEIFDKLLHIFGIYFLVLFVYTIMNQFMKLSFKSRLNKLAFLILIGISLGSIFEILEFIVDMTIKPKIPNQPSLMDTDLDLIADCIGALIASFHLCLIKTKQGGDSPASN